MATDTKISFFNGENSKIKTQLANGTLTPCDFIVGLTDNTLHYIDGDSTDRQLGVSSAQLEAVEEEVKRNALSFIGQYAGRDISAILADEIASGKTVYDALHARVQAANYEGLRIGDYLDVTLQNQTAVTSLSKIRFLIAHFDPYYQCGDTEKGHHIAFVAETSIPVSSTYSNVVNSSYIQWNTTATNNGTSSEPSPYVSSNLKKWEKAFQACLPSALLNVLLEQRVLMETRYTAGSTLTASNSWDWKDIGKVWSLSETEVYGQCVWGTKGYSVGFDCQFDIFRQGTRRRLNGDRTSRWLRTVSGSSATHACSVNGYGYANYTSVTYGWYRPWVGFLVG